MIIMPAISALPGTGSSLPGISRPQGSALAPSFPPSPDGVHGGAGQVDGLLMILSGFLVGNFAVVTDCALWAEIDHMYQDH